jgi:hypothetical protein
LIKSSGAVYLEIVPRSSFNNHHYKSKFLGLRIF